MLLLALFVKTIIEFLDCQFSLPALQYGARSERVRVSIFEASYVDSKAIFPSMEVTY
jgi:hypothetical protein